MGVINVLLILLQFRTKIKCRNVFYGGRREHSSDQTWHPGSRCSTFSKARKARKMLALTSLQRAQALPLSRAMQTEKLLQTPNLRCQKALSRNSAIVGFHVRLRTRLNRGRWRPRKIGNWRYSTKQVTAEMVASKTADSVLCSCQRRHWYASGNHVMCQIGMYRMYEGGCKRTRVLLRF